MNLREKLEFLMENEGINKADLSKGTGAPYTTVDGILKRDNFEKIKLSTLNKLKKYFNVTIDYLVDDDITTFENVETLDFKTNLSNMAIEENLKKLILKKYRSLKAFAENASIPYTTLYSILERGIENASIHNVIKIFDTLGIDIKQTYKIKCERTKLKAEEYQLIKKYCLISEPGKKFINKIMDDLILYEQSSKEK